MCCHSVALRPLVILQKGSLPTFSSAKLRQRALRIVLCLVAVNAAVTLRNGEIAVFAHGLAEVEVTEHTLKKCKSLTSVFDDMAKGPPA